MTLSASAKINSFPSSPGDKLINIAQNSSNNSQPPEMNVYQVLLSAAPPNKTLLLPVDGGSDNGQFCFVGKDLCPSKLVYHPVLSSSKMSSSIIRPGDIILEIGDYQIAGYTKLDALRLCESLSSCCDSSPNRPRVLVKLISFSAFPGSGISLSHFLSSSFAFGSPEYLLQEVIRDNIYQRVVPCTTRPPRPDEVDGVHYKFLKVDEFIALVKSGLLLESGNYKGNYYGTPRPDPTATALDSVLNSGKMIRTESRHIQTISSKGSSGALKPSSPVNQSQIKKDIHALTTSAHLPLSETENVFQDSERALKNPSMALSEDPTFSPAFDNCNPLLPNGWEIVTHPEYGTFYIDHLHKKTQYEAPTTADFQEAANFFSDVNLPTCSAQLRMNIANASSQLEELTTPVSVCSSKTTPLNHRGSCSSYSSSSSSLSSSRSRRVPRFFTSDISQLRGPLVTIVLVKGPRGFGFTIVGGSTPFQPGFLQVKNVIPDGPAALDGLLSVGDVLVSTNEVNVLGFSHYEIVSLFQSIRIGEKATLVVSQGYSLWRRPNNPENPDLSTAELSPTDKVPFAAPDLCIRRLNTSPTISQSSSEQQTSRASRKSTKNVRPEFIKVSIVKQHNGFGFTLADQPQGQCVKEVLDPSRCDGLHIGDIFVEINDERVKEMSHLKVVQLLKTCPIGKETRFLVQRGQYCRSINNPTEDLFDSHFLHLPDCDSISSCDSHERSFPFGSAPNAQFPIFHPNISNVSQTSSPSKITLLRFRSKTPAPDGKNSSRSNALGSSSDCIYSLGDSFTGLDLVTSRAQGRNMPKFAAVEWPLSSTQYSSRFCNDLEAYSSQRVHSRCESNGWESLRRSHKISRARPKDKIDAERLPPYQGGEALLSSEFRVRIRCQSSAGYGFKLLGGAEEGTPLSIGPLISGGSAEKVGLIKTGDNLISINGECVLGERHRTVVQLLEKSSRTVGEVTLGLCRPQAPNLLRTSQTNNQIGSYDAFKNSSSTIAASVCSQKVILHRSRQEEGFGFVISCSPSTTVHSHHIVGLIPGSPAERSRQLHIGDRLLTVNGISITGLRHDDILRTIQESGRQVVLTILPRTLPLYENHCESNLPSAAPPHIRTVLFEITLFRASRGFGFSIRGGHEFNRMPLTVLRIAEGGAAYLDDRLKVGDELVQINGHFTAGMSHRRAVEIIQAGGNTIRLIVRRASLTNCVVPSSQTPFGLHCLPPNLKPDRK